GREERKHSAMSAVEIEKGDRSDTKSTLSPRCESILDDVRNAAANNVHILRAVQSHNLHTAALLLQPAVEIHEWSGLFVIHRQTLANCLLPVVLALHERLPGNVILVSNFGWIILNVIYPAGVGMDATTTQTLHDDLVLHRDLDNDIDVDACIHHGLGLWNRARESVEQEAVGTVRLGDALLDQCNDDLIGDQSA